MADRGSTRSSRLRKAELRRVPSRESGWSLLRFWPRTPAHAYGMLLGLAFLVVTTLLVVWAREQPLVAVDRVMDRTRVVRLDFTIVDEVETERRRREARRNTPRVYVASRDAFDLIASSLEGLPAALADAEALEQVAPEIRDAFALTTPALAAVRAESVEGGPSESWSGKVGTLMGSLRLSPVLARDTYQLEQQETSPVIELRWEPESAPTVVHKSSAINIEGLQHRTRMREMVVWAGFTHPVDDMVTGYLVRLSRPLYVHDEGLTNAARDAAAARIEPVSRTDPAGTVVFMRGDRLSADRYGVLLEEMRAFRDHAHPARVWAPRLGTALLALIVTVALGAYVRVFCPRVVRKPARMATLAVLMTAALGVSVMVAARDPGLMLMAATGPVVFVGAVVLIAYDQRTALALGLAQGLLTCIALDRGVGTLGVAMVGVGTAVWQLRELRHRNAMVRGGVAVGLGVVVAALAASLLERPMTPRSADGLWPITTEEIVVDSLLAGLGGLLAVGVLTLILPSIEKLFGIMTGMTLIELRDPKQPLLRELQQRAPGTYNHSLTVATLAEAAAETIGANSLELYVGALYHDVGKMNKPDYFVENQSPGFNRHTKLSPAMSLLVIVGHVKDGLEFAREYNLPRPLHHYIESHHGTTLVEYFYHQAVQKAEKTESEDAPSEVEYRYPGPRPRTKEAGILMLCDAVESAARAMADPTPSRISALVRSLASKRLADGQFDDCDLSLREVRLIEDALIRALCSIYHGRIAYPDGGTRTGEEKPATASATAPATRQVQGQDGATPATAPVTGRGA